MSKPVRKRQKLTTRTNETAQDVVAQTIKTEPINKSEDDEQAELKDKLSKLKEKLEKLFKIEFLNSLAYLIEVEHQRQGKFEVGLAGMNWKLLDYFMQQLKKICKNKKHLLCLINNMLIHVVKSKDGAKAEKTTETNHDGTTATSSKAINQHKSLVENIYDYSNLINELDSLDSCDYFCLTGVLVRLLYKLIKSTNSGATLNADSTKSYNLILVILSCLADICYYEEVRIQVINDSNLKCLFELFAQKTITDIESKQTSSAKMESLPVSTNSSSSSLTHESVFNIDDIKKLWSKMCRLAANLCLEKSSKRIRNLFTSDYIKSLCKCIEQQQLQNQTKEPASFEVNTNDIDFYHSLLRFLRYGCELSSCKNLLLQNRLLVYICKYMFKLNKNLHSNQEAECSSANNKPNSKRPLIKELIKQYFVILESWPTPLCSEYYNQIIEGNVIEHLLWVYTDEPSLDLGEEKRPGTPSSTSTDTNSTETPTSTFNHAEFSFNLLYKLCYDYANCRSEFGRMGGLSKFINKIESFSAPTSPDKKEYNQEYERLIEMICLSCKEATNRSRLREQGFLVNLIKLQQSLKQINISNPSNSKCLESTLHNKLLVALCCFVYDQDSLSVLLNNGLIDCLLTYLNDSVMNTNEISKKQFSFTFKPGKTNTELQDMLKIESKQLYLNKILSMDKNSAKQSSDAQRKRKSSDPNINPSSSANPKPSSTKRRKLNTSELSPPPLPHSFSTSNIPILQPSPSPSYNQTRLISPYSSIDSSLNYLTDIVINDQQQYMTDKPQATSPTESYCSLSPTPNAFSPTFSLSSPQNSSRCQSAMIFSSLSTAGFGNLQNSTSAVFSNLSPSSSSNELTLSPYLNWPGSISDEQVVNTNIQFSPSIKNENSSDESMSENEDDEDYEDNSSNQNQAINDPIKYEFLLKQEKAEVKQAEASKADLDKSMELMSSPIHYLNEDAKMSLTKSPQREAQKSIESINRTEACVFYVLSQLSHGDKPSSHLITNFESILSCLLNYLKYAKVRNPRALRILNRLTKNQFCFYNFVVSQFPYKVKKIFFDENNPNKTSSKKFEEKIKAEEQDKKAFPKSHSTAFTTNSRYYDRSLSKERAEANSKENDIEKEMNIYLNSNKVFFDAHTFFPSFESIEFTLCNNLKSLCMSSSDHGYSCLTSMMKNSQRKIDRISCALVAPFILRNCRALHYIMVELNGVDLILDSLLSKTSTSPVEDTLDDSLKPKAILCMQKILSFVSYKRDLKQINDSFDAIKEKYYENYVNNESLARQDDDVYVCFEFLDNQDSTKKINAKKELLIKKSEYFSALLNGHFSESIKRDVNNLQTIEIKDISYEAFLVIVDLLQCRPDETVNNPTEQSAESKQFNYQLTFDLCYGLVLACDRLFLTDLKDLFISILICKFLTLSTWSLCFQLAWYLNNSFLANASVDYLLSKFQFFPIKKTKLLKLNTESDHSDEFLNEVLSLNDEQDKEELIYFEGVFDYLLSNLQFNLNESNQFINDPDKEKQILDYFRKILKLALSEIIKNNYWKF